MTAAANVSIVVVVKAAFVNDPGEPDALIYGGSPEPQIGAEDLPVRGKATSLNRGDVFAREGSRCYASLRQGGRFVNSGVTAGHRVELHLGQLWTRELSLLGTAMKPREDMPKIMKLVRAGKLRGVVSQIYPLAEAAQAHAVMERNESFGKIVLVP